MRPTDVNVNLDVRDRGELIAELTSRVFTGGTMGNENAVVTNFDAPTHCPHCHDRTARSRLLWAWGTLLGGAASLVAAGAAAAQVFFP